MKRSLMHLTALTTALVAALLAACGGADMLPPVSLTAADAAARTTAAVTPTATTEPVAPLLDDEGQPVPTPATVGGGTGRTLAVASVAQATMLTHGRPHGVVQVSVDESGEETVERDGTLIACGPLAAGGFDAEAMVFVAAADLSRAEAVAQRLVSAGQARVWVLAQ